MKQAPARTPAERREARRRADVTPQRTDDDREEDVVGPTEPVPILCDRQRPSPLIVTNERGDLSLKESLNRPNYVEIASLWYDTCALGELPPIPRPFLRFVDKRLPHFMTWDALGRNYKTAKRVKDAVLHWNATCADQHPKDLPPDAKPTHNGAYRTPYTRMDIWDVISQNKASVEHVVTQYTDLSVEGIVSTDPNNWMVETGLANSDRSNFPDELCPSSIELVEVCFRSSWLSRGFR